VLRKSTKPSGDFELVSWFFMRASGALLVVLILTHIGIVHYVFGVEKINFALVAKRWSTPTWRIFDLVMLTLALLHGGNGVRMLIEDYVRSSGWRTLAVSALYTVVFLLLFFGAIVMLTFRPPG
jgi:succinate dehydrogenase / fumarate reductase membrane anchor subunit